MIQLFISGTLRLKRCHIMGNRPRCQGRSVNKRYHPVKHHSGADIWPVKRLNQGLRQGQTRCFDNDMIGQRPLFQQFLHAWQKIIGHRATDTAIGKLDNIIDLTSLGGAIAKHRRIHADIAKLIDDQCQTFASSMADDMTNQRGFSRPQKSSDNSCRNTGIHLDKLRLINNGKATRHAQIWRQKRQSRLC